MDQMQADGGMITLIHFIFSLNGSLAPNSWRIACTPNMTEFHKTVHHPNRQYSEDSRAVTCPSCKRTTQFLDHKRRCDALYK